MSAEAAVPRPSGEENDSPSGVNEIIWTTRNAYKVARSDPPHHDGATPMLRAEARWRGDVPRRREATLARSDNAWTKPMTGRSVY